MAIFPDILPATFSIEEAADLLEWQGSMPGLAHSLKADGYVKFRAAVATSNGHRSMWRRPALVTAQEGRSPVDEDRWQCGDDELIAKVALRLVERNAIATAEAFYWLESQITTAGPEFSREMLKRFADEEVPF